ncbi:MAG: hypothetical protein ACLQJR_31385 [Stellaceae bacterium]
MTFIIPSPLADVVSEELAATRAHHAAVQSGDRQLIEQTRETLARVLQKKREMILPRSR